jgi:hypothetical protein
MFEFEERLKRTIALILFGSFWFSMGIIVTVAVVNLI